MKISVKIKLIRYQNRFYMQKYINFAEIQIKKQIMEKEQR